MSERPEITSADLAHGVEMGKINDGYFSNSVNASAFVDIAIHPLLDGMPATVRHASFGGGEGFLDGFIVAAITASGREVRSTVVDANPGFLALAAKRGFETLCASLEDVELGGLDLVTMRSVNHYNSPAVQRRILERCLACLRPGGRLASQNLSGPSDAYCHMASMLSRLPELGRVHDELDRPHITSEREFNGFMTGAGFADVHVAGSAPDIIVGPAYYWARFNARDRAQAEADGDRDACAAFDRRERAYLARANAEIDAFLTTAPPEDAALIQPLGGSYSLPLHFPVHVGRRPA